PPYPPPSSPPSPAPAGAEPCRIGCVSYLNTLPLIEGLGKLADVRLTLTAPARLIDLLLDDSIDAGLISLIDYQRSPVELALVPVGMIGCDGPTMTVRLFTKRPLGEWASAGPGRPRVHADADSHTSVVLMQVLLAERFGVRPEVVEWDVDRERAARQGRGVETAADWPDALLIIGDKVVTDSPPAGLYPHQLDLGAAWKDLTGLPFVYAMWMTRADRASAPAIRAAAAVLDRQRRHNATRLDWLVAHRAPPRGWPADLALTYVRSLLRYEVTDAARAAVERFFDLAHAHGLLPARRPVRWAEAL
ncbi:MAG: menaquinone biosynthesis protein, partial [Phycisphaerales bacterium]|nr:menaquinone biosynthesis protein [Phycisphaerales bacterium]